MTIDNRSVPTASFRQGVPESSCQGWRNGNESGDYFWLFMDSGLFWSAPAKRRSRIEPQRWGIPAVFAGNLDAGFHSRRGDGAFP